MKRSDYYIIIAVVLIAGFFMVLRYFNADKNQPAHNLYVELSVNSRIVNTFPLDEEREIPWADGDAMNTIYIHDNGVEIIDANCRDKVCVAAGLITQPGQMIVCLPHKLVIQIKSHTDSEVPIDAVSQ